jgi:hypothetical protein
VTTVTLRDQLHLQVLAPDATTVMGTLVLKMKAGALSGTGTLHDVPISVTGRRPLSRPPWIEALSRFDLICTSISSIPSRSSAGATERRCARDSALR